MTNQKKENQNNMMTENLSQLIKQGTSEEPVIFSEEDLDLALPEQPVEQVQELTSISITNFSDWLDSNIGNFPNMRKPNMNLVGVNQEEQVLLSIGVGQREDGSEKRKIIIFDNANTTPVLDIPAIDMQIYSNGFRTVHDLNNGIFVKSYGIRVGLVVVFCYDLDDLVIPYYMTRAKKKNTNIDVILSESNIVRSKLAEVVDLEALQLRYKQSAKAEGLRTNLDAVKWLTTRQSTIEDVNHHIQIDNVIIDMLS